MSVADGLDTDDQDATVGIQVRGVFNELQLLDLRKKTLRGQIGQNSAASSLEKRPTAIGRSLSAKFGWTRRVDRDQKATR